MDKYYIRAIVMKTGKVYHWEHVYANNPDEACTEVQVRMNDYKHEFEDYRITQINLQPCNS